MIYALLAAVSSVTPTATPVPTAFPVSIAEDLTGLSLCWEKTGILATIVLGLAAFVTSVIALVMARQQHRSEVKMRDIEHNIAVFDRVLELKNFFLNCMRDEGFFMEKDCYTKILTINNTAQLLFDDDTYRVFEKEIQRLIQYACYKKLPELSDLLVELKQVNPSITDEKSDTWLSQFSDMEKAKLIILTDIIIGKTEPIITQFGLKLKRSFELHTIQKS